MEKKKVTRKDLPITRQAIYVDVIQVDGRTINLTPVPHMHIEQYITHGECVDCGKEFKKIGTYDKRCLSCQWKNERERYSALELIEWDVETPLCVFDDDRYFFHIDDILDYCHENETKPSELMLVLCKTTTFSTIDYDYWCDQVHEDWEPSNEFEKRLKEFNEFLKKESTNTWWATNKRVDVSDLDNYMEDVEVGS